MDPDDEFWKLAENISDELKLALGDLVINCGRMEIALGNLIAWASHTENIQISRLLFGRLQVRHKRELAKQVLEQLTDETPLKKFQEIDSDISAVITFRNNLMHGWWMPLGKNAAAALSPKPRGKKQIEWSALEGMPVTLDEIEKHSQLALESYRAIQRLVNQPAPPLQALDGKLPC